MTKARAYPKSKILAEKACWDFVAERKANGEETFELVTVLPSAVFGRTKISTKFSSGQMVWAILNGYYPGVDSSIPACSVHEVSIAHLEAAKRPEAAGERFIVCTRMYTASDLIEVYRKEFEPLGYGPISSEIKHFRPENFDDLSPEEKETKEMLGVRYSVSREKSEKVLELKYDDDFDQILIDFAYSLIESGVIEDKRTTK